MTTTTTAPTYRAQTDPSTTRWHLGTAEAGARCVCGARLMTPEDTRAFALKVPADRRNYETSDDLTRVSCGGCKRTREYLTATAAPLAEAAAERDDEGQTDEMSTVGQAARPSRRRARTDPRADRAAAE